MGRWVVKTSVKVTRHISHFVSLLVSRPVASDHSSLAVRPFARSCHDPGGFGWRRRGAGREEGVDGGDSGIVGRERDGKWDGGTESSKRTSASVAAVTSELKGRSCAYHPAFLPQLRSIRCRSSHNNFIFSATEPYRDLEALRKVCRKEFLVKRLERRAQTVSFDQVNI